MKQLMGYAAVAAFALLLVGAGSVSALTLKDDVEGKVVSFEKGKSIEIEVGAEKKTFTVDDTTEIKGEVAVGKAVKVHAKEGAAVKIEVKE
jgi:hypothetical protein